MQIIEFDKNSIFTDQDLKQFFRENDFLFPDPFANHFELDTYMDKLIRYGVILIAEEDQKILGICRCFSFPKTFVVEESEENLRCHRLSEQE